MKNIPFLFLLFLMACQPIVFFESPQPAFQEALTVIPSEFRGSYIFASDSTIVRASESVIVIDYYTEHFTDINDVQESASCKIMDGNLYLKESNHCIPYESITEDIVRSKKYRVDTIFEFSNHQVAKLYKNKLLLNYSDNEGHWMVNVISPIENGVFIWEYIDIPKDLNVLSNIDFNYKKIEQEDSDHIYLINPDSDRFENIFTEGNVTFSDTIMSFNIQ